MNTLKTRLVRRQRLTLGESDRLFRLAHVTAMAEVLFGDDQKAQRWLSNPSSALQGNNPLHCSALPTARVWLRNC
jgi:putative toxin-antitoxin system antitoxin component (TIGR02293 family)